MSIEEEECVYEKHFVSRLWKETDFSVETSTELPLVRRTFSFSGGFEKQDDNYSSVAVAEGSYASLKRIERSRKDDDGMPEALLLAEYGRRTYMATKPMYAG